MTGRFCAAILLALMLTPMPRISWAGGNDLLSLQPSAGVEWLFLDTVGVRVLLDNGRVGRLVVRDGQAEMVFGDPLDGVKRGLPPEGLPDGQYANNPIANDVIRRAWLTQPTRRYDHGVLGDAIEAAGVMVETGDGRKLELTLPTDSVFEDRMPRLADLDGDGRAELFAVRSYLDRGAAVAVLGLVDGKLVMRATSEPIGLPHRWLNPVGVSDFDGDGRVEIAVVVTPHIGGILKIGRLRGDRLDMRAVGRDFSNHFIGSRELGMSAVIDWNGDGIPDMAIPDGQRRALRLITLAGGTLSDLARIPLPGQVVTAIINADMDGNGREDLAFGLDDGKLHVILAY